MFTIKKPKLAAQKIQTDDYATVRDQATWISSNGRALRLSQMDTNHIKNALRLLERGEKPDREEQWIPLFEDELAYRYQNGIK